MESIPLRHVSADGRRLAYRELGSGPAVLLLHGWPTSSLLWREMMPQLARHHRVIAPDLPGFGASDKPIDIRYTFAFFESLLDGLCSALKIDDLALGVHDIGGPVGIHWALTRPLRVRKLALLNTLIYPEFSEDVLAFVRSLSTPDLREKLTSPEGLTELIREGVEQPSSISTDLLTTMLAPFREPPAREALALAAIGLSTRGFHEIASRLPELGFPVRIVYGERDRLLPDVADTMARVQRDLPHAVATALPDCGHFLQIDAPDRVGTLLAEFFRG
jgi:pimeloyl-ACP methyl ester carboxylesterase